MALLQPPEIIPTTEAAFQTINVVLGGQSCRIELYTKSINIPIEEPDTIPPTPVEMASFTGAISGSVLTVSEILTGVVLPENVLFGAGISIPTYVVEQLTGDDGGVGTYSVSPSVSSAITPMLMRTFSAALPTYENANPVFLDLYVDNALVVGGVLCYNWSRIVIDSYLGFIGDLSVIDTQGNEDPQGTPLRLPPPDLRNWWQRNLPLSLGGRLLPATANRIPGLGSRFLLTYWPNLA